MSFVVKLGPVKQNADDWTEPGTCLVCVVISPVKEVDKKFLTSPVLVEVLANASDEIPVLNVFPATAIVVTGESVFVSNKYSEAMEHPFTLSSDFQ